MVMNAPVSPWRFLLVNGPGVRLWVDDCPLDFDRLSTQGSCLSGHLPIRGMDFHDDGGNLQDAILAHSDFPEDLAFPIKELDLEGCSVLP